MNCVTALTGYLNTQPKLHSANSRNIHWSELFRIIYGDVATHTPTITPLGVSLPTGNLWWGLVTALPRKILIIF